MSANLLTVTEPENSTIVKQQTVRLFDEKNPLKLVCGKQINQVDVAFESYGKLSPLKDNVILVVHALTGSAHAAFRNYSHENEPGWWDGLIGPGKALDTDKYLIISTNLLGSCYGTTGPASLNLDTGEIYGANFPPVTTIDMVRVQKDLLDYLKIPGLVSIIGGSLGAMVVWQFAVSYPEIVQSAIPVAGSFAASPWVISLNEVARQSIFLDPHWREPGNGSRSNGIGLKLARMISMISYRSEISFNQRFRRDRLSNTCSDNFNPDNRFQVENYLHHQGEKLVDRFDRFSYLTLTRAMDWHDISFGFESVTDACKKIQAKILSIGIDTDRLFSATGMRQEADFLSTLGKTAFYDEIKTVHGHDAFLIEFDQLNRIIKPFLERI